MSKEPDRYLETLREIVAEVLEMEPSEVSDTADFVEEYSADSLRAIEILARIEKRFGIEIPQNALAEMRNLEGVRAIVARYAPENA
jgi:acyl carrier protein